LICGFKRTKIYEYCLAIVKWWVFTEKFSEINVKNISKILIGAYFYRKGLKNIF